MQPGGRERKRKGQTNGRVRHIRGKSNDEAGNGKDLKQDRKKRRKETIVKRKSDEAGNGEELTTDWKKRKREGQ